METATLPQITDELREIEVEIADAEGVITPEIEARLNAMEGAWEEKVERILGFYHEMDALAGAAKANADRLRDRAKTYANRAASLKGLLEWQLRRAGKRRADTAEGQAYFQKNPPSVQVKVAPEGLPEQFRRVVPETVEADKKALLEAWKEQEDVSEWADVIQTESLRVK